MPRHPQIPLSSQLTYLEFSDCNETCRRCQMDPPESVQTLISIFYWWLSWIIKQKYIYPYWGGLSRKKVLCPHMNGISGNGFFSDDGLVIIPFPSKEHEIICTDVGQPKRSCWRCCCQCCCRLAVRVGPQNSGFPGNSSTVWEILKLN